ncbi:MAG: 5'-3' exonuclease H3TH domain-containing protein [Buchnera aphidicola (Melaphis rhois)]
MVYNKKNIDYLLIDGTSHLYRAYYSFSSLSNKNGVPSGAIYGVINTLKKLVLEYPYSQIIIAFDSPNKTFRHTLFQYYKVNRKMMPTNLKVQIKPLYRIIKTIGFPIIIVPNFEADDIIGTLAHEANNKNKFTLISTNDKDLGQLVNSHTSILEMKSKKILGEEEIKKKHGVIPTLIPDLFGLMGDKSDNIPGVSRIGEKTAICLLKKFGSLKNIYNNTDNISQCSFRGAKNIAKILIKNKTLAFLSKNLATIKTDILMPKSINELKTSPTSTYELSYLFKYYDFNNWLRLLNQGEWLTNTVF